ncbi:MAG: hypothetical protein AB9834_00315 [Lentimicrobium sp.]
MPENCLSRTKAEPPKQPVEIRPKQRTKQGRKTASAGRKSNPKTAGRDQAKTAHKTRPENCLTRTKAEPQNSRTKSGQISAPNKAGKLPHPDESRITKIAGRNQAKSAHQTRPENCLTRTKAESPKQPDENRTTKQPDDVNKATITHTHI